jgi:hypothetical protein
VLAAGGCHKAAVVTTRTVTTYVPAACAADGGAFAEYHAYGDFDPPSPPETGHLFSDVGEALPEVYGATRALVVTAAEGQAAWQGLAAVAPSGDVNVLVTPTLTSCALSTAVATPAGDAGTATGQSMGLVASEVLLFVGGTGSSGPPTYAADLATGAVTSLGEKDLQYLRAFATVTAFGSNGLVAGGFDGSVVRGEAEVYAPSDGGFGSVAAIPLTYPRWHHGAVVLADGRTLLVGGYADAGKTQLVGSMEIVDPRTGRSHAESVATLAMPRADPTVLRLASGEILVAGGVQADGSPAGLLEWFAPDASATSKNTFMLTQGPGSAFAALDAGGFLAVLTTPSGSTGSFANTYVFDATGAPEPAAVFPGNVTSPVLFGAASGMPALWTGSQWLEWQAYAGEFAPLGVLDDVPAHVGPVTASPDPGLATWLDPTSGALVLLRFDTANAYSSLPGPLLDTDVADTAPDRLGGVDFDPTLGMTFPPGSPGPAVFVTDRTYADVSVSVTAPTGVLPFVVLTDDVNPEIDVGGVSCPLPPLPAGPVTLTAVRRGASLGWSTDGGASGTCPESFGGGVRVSVGLRGQATATAVAQDLVVTRLGEP